MARQGSATPIVDYEGELQRLLVERDEALSGFGQCVERQAYAEQQTVAARHQLEGATQALVYHQTVNRPSTFGSTDNGAQPEDAARH